MGKILVTGASGFIGSHLLEYLVKDGCKDIRILVAPWENLTNISGFKGEIVVGDIRDRAVVKKAVSGVEVIYHLAAKTVVDGGTYDYYKDTNVFGTKNVLSAAKSSGIKKIIFFSSISVFGLPAWRGDMHNCSEAWSKNYSEGYGKTKLEAEKLVESSKIPYIIIRPTTVYGPKDKAGLFQMYKAINKNIFFFIGNAKNKMDYIYVEDLVRAARLAEKSSLKNEDFIIGLGKPTSQGEIAKYVAKSIGKKLPSVYIPKILALVLSYAVEAASKLIGIKPLLFPKRVKVLTANCYFDTTKARKMLKFVPKYDINLGTHVTAEWLVKNNML